LKAKMYIYGRWEQWPAYLWRRSTSAGT